MLKPVRVRIRYRPRVRNYLRNRPQRQRHKQPNPRQPPRNPAGPPLAAIPQERQQPIRPNRRYHHQRRVHRREKPAVNPVRRPPQRIQRKQIHPRNRNREPAEQPTSPTRPRRPQRSLAPHHARSNTTHRNRPQRRDYQPRRRPRQKFQPFHPNPRRIIISPPPKLAQRTHCNLSQRVVPRRLIRGEIPRQQIIAPQPRRHRQPRYQPKHNPPPQPIPQRRAHLQQHYQPYKRRNHHPNIPRLPRQCAQNRRPQQRRHPATAEIIIRPCHRQYRQQNKQRLRQCRRRQPHQRHRHRQDKTRPPHKIAALQPPPQIPPHHKYRHPKQPRVQRPSHHDRIRHPQTRPRHHQRIQRRPSNINLPRIPHQPIPAQQIPRHRHISHRIQIQQRPIRNLPRQHKRRPQRRSRGHHQRQPIRPS